ncbi:MAG: DUF2254 domain-containing protein [Actinobacteria bacterium]|mgnify:CR=1 FL=1|nr:DUF2254 domain-containing protein [Actinomycetota bacterium]
MLGSAKLRQLGSRLAANYWFIPSAMMITAVGLSFLLPWVDRRIGGVPGSIPGWIYEGGTDGARAVLSTIAGSMMTVAALVFSITIVGLTTASQQFGPRLLRNFITDRGYQVVLGTFLANFIYCLLVLRTVEEVGDEHFVPYVSIAVALLLAIAGVGVLVYFIHHAAFSLRADNIVAAIGRELKSTIDRLYPARQDDALGANSRPESNGRKLPEGFPSGARDVPARKSGYIQSIDQDRLAKLAQEHQLVLRLDYRPGQFLTEDETLVNCWPDIELPDDLLNDLNQCVVVGPQRPLAQDVESAIEQLVGLALRALSPGINDPDTAILCIDQLTDALTRAAERDIPAALLPAEGEVSLVTYPLTFPRMVDQALSRIRQHGRGSVPVTVRLLEALAAIGQRAQNESSRTAVSAQAQMLKRSSDEAIPEENDRRLIDMRFRAVEKALERSAAA